MEYEELLFKIRRIWKMQETEMIPIIAGALECMAQQDLPQNLNKLNIDHLVSTSTIQGVTVLGSGKTLRQFMNL